MNEWKITGRTGLTGLLGSPVAHSISPLMHNESFRLLGLDYVYLCFDVGEARLEDAVRGLAACGIRGFNLTMPDKTRMAELADELSPAARLIGAVNTVVNENGRLIGHNTDGVGFLRSVKDAGLSVAGQNLTVLGAGGAATAICAQAALDGAASIRIFARPSSRFHARALSLADTICRTTACRAELWDQADTAALKKSLEDSLLLINATSVGMAPDTEHSLIEDMSLLPPSLTVADIIYNPRETRLLRLARESGHKTFNGMYMLLYQGAEAFRLWTGMDMPVDTIRDKYFR
ncbi:MAG TPA: shikimate dehydrogenase [Candidatus Scatomonas pullistercoris]|uniref:Shikimate dehydrogenase (NADP(+)) n=1 Tax=Candidatus Scatomonas pullistercoris TaxID=2840920 RepID=A0A9D1P1S3_9FIRM|nr:shikimate dehydrogenase [Candidatus Scatomonas pullistercoris]